MELWSGLVYFKRLDAHHGCQTRRAFDLFAFFNDIVRSGRLELSCIPEESKILETHLLSEISVYASVVSPLHLSGLLVVVMAPVNQKIVCKNIEVDSREIHLVQARRFVSSVANESFVTPSERRREVSVTVAPEDNVRFVCMGIGLLADPVD